MNIVEYLEKHDMSQKAFAELLTARNVPVTPGLISHYVTGRVSISAERALLIQEATDGEITKEALRPDLWEKTA